MFRWNKMKKYFVKTSRKKINCSSRILELHRVLELVCVGDATFGHRPKARGPFRSNDKVFCRLGILSERRALGFKRRGAKTKVQQRRRRRAKRGEDQGPNSEDEGERREARTKVQRRRVAKRGIRKRL